MELKATRYAVSEGVALITLNRPERRNSWTGRMEREYRWALCEAEADPSVRVIVVTGTGEAFCVGADMAVLDGMGRSGEYDLDHEAALPQPGRGSDPEYELGHGFTFAIGKPIVAAINGPAAGVGFVLACFADIRFAAAGAKLTTSVGRLGLPAEHGLSWLLPRIIGLGAAADLLLSSRVISAEEAQAMGLVHAVFPAGELLDKAMAYAQRMAAEISPSSMAVIKGQLYADLRRSFGDAATFAEAAMRRMLTEDDFKEGVDAFTHRRAPRFASPAPVAPRWSG